MAGLLVGLSVMAVLMSVALPQWSHQARREKEIELIWRGQQYARAIELFQRRFANAFPPTIDVLVEQRFLRQKYKDPITDDDFQPIYVGQAPAGAPQAPGAGQPGAARTPAPMASIAGAQGPIIGVTSKSTETSIRLWNGRNRYNEWAFVHMPAATQPGMPGGGGPAGIPPPGQPPGPGGRPIGGPGTAPPSGARPPVTLPPLQPGDPRRPPGAGR